MLEELYKIYRSELIHWCTGMTHNRNAAEDLVQEAFYKALQNEELLTTMDLPQRRAWLYRVTKNLFVDHTRRAAFEQAREDIPETADRSTSCGAYENAELLLQLPEDERALFILRYLDGYNSTELGKLFSMSPGTVRAKLSSARKHLRKELEG